MPVTDAQINEIKSELHESTVDRALLRHTVETGFAHTAEGISELKGLVLSVDERVRSHGESIAELKARLDERRRRRNVTLAKLLGGAITAITALALLLKAALTAGAQ